MGLFVEGGVAIGHRRLKIIDLSTAAAQPIWLPDRSICMTYNGEIHNYRQLAEELRSAGVPLRADNDTEVLLWSYRTWGEKCFEKLNGMWAAAFWHPSRRELILSRDRFGIKPLLYSLKGPRVAFASEAKAILAAFPEERRPNPRHVLAFINDELTDPDAGESTFFDNIHSVLPGQLLRIESTRESKAKHWHFKLGVESPRSEAPEAFLHLLRDAVQLRLRSDVPVAVLLSGGLDSSTVARLAAGDSQQPLECISLKYTSKSLDESRYAQMVADNPHRYRIHWVTPSAEGLMPTIESIVWHHDAPTPLRGRYPQWHVLREASRFATVVLGGNGADELLGGYDRMIWPYFRDRLDRRLPNRSSRWSLPGDLYGLGRVSKGIHRILPQLLFNEVARRLRSQWKALHTSTLPSASVTAATGPPRGPYQSRLNNALWHEFRTAGLPELLHAEDALSMAFSLESRLPFLDHRLVEFCFSLEYQEKIARGWTKSLLRRATQGILPEQVRCRRHKLGFPWNFAGWLGDGAGLDSVRQLMTDKRTLERGWLDRDWLLDCFGRSRHHATKYIRANPQQTWRTVTLEIWFRQFIDQNAGWRPAPQQRSPAKFGEVAAV